MVNRKIKFRAWDEKEKYMAIQGTSDIETLGSFMNLFSKFPLMQYTGLKDKHRKEIYEGDIVIIWDSIKSNAYNKIGNPIGKIMFDEGGFYFRGIRNDIDWEDISHHTLNYRLTIIGNIHQNPELLK